MAECSNYGCGCGSAPPAASVPKAQYGCGGACHAYGGHIVPRLSVMNMKIHRAAGKAKRAARKAHRRVAHKTHHGKSSW